MESGFGDREIMFYRAKFVTNSSSTSFVAWGYIVPEELCSKLEDDDFYDNLYGGGPNVDGTPDDYGHILIYSRQSRINADGSVTIGLGEDDLDQSEEKWGEELRSFAGVMGITLANLAPGWFFTRYLS